jgi:uroporphyrinogen-III synthase
LLDNEKINYTKAVIYRTVANDLKHIDINKYDMMIFFSPAGIESLKSNFPQFTQGEKLIAAFGKTTAMAVKNAGMKINVPAPTQSAPSMTMAVEEFLVKLNKENRRNGKK